MPSSPHLKARDRACSWGKSGGSLVVITMDFNGFKTSYDSMHHHQDYNPHALEVSVSISTLWKGAREITSGPLSLSNVGTPFLPVCLPFSILLQSLLFLGEILMVIYFDHDD